MAQQKPVILELVDTDSPPYVYLEDTVNLDDDGEGTLYSVKEFCEEIGKGKVVSNAPSVVKAMLSYLMSGDTDQERDPKYLAKAYNLAHGLEKS